MDILKYIPSHNNHLLASISDSEVAQSCPTLWDPMDCSLPGSSVHGISQQGYWSGLPFPSPGDLRSPGIEPGSPTLRADALPTEPPGQPQCRSRERERFSLHTPLSATQLPSQRPLLFLVLRLPWMF